MTTPVDPWPSDEASPFDRVPIEERGDDRFRDDADDRTYDRASSEAFTVPLNTGGMTRPLSWTRPAPRSRLANRPPLDRSSLPTLFLGIGIGAVLTSIVAALIIAGLADSSTTRRALATVPITTRGLPTVTPTRTPTPTPVPTVAATFVATDTTTQGTWQGVYGNQGVVVVGDTQQLPAGIQVTPSGAGGVVWAPTTADPRAPQKVSNSADRIAACWYAPTTFSIDVNITDGQAHRLALYLLDWDSQNRSEVVTVADPATGVALDTRVVSGFVGGVYLVWTVRGHVVLGITDNAGSINAVVSSLYFSAP